MTISGQRTIVVTGATGLQGGAVARRLLQQGWAVRALTRNAASTQARGLASLGAEVMQGDMEDIASLRPVFADAYAVYSVQNPFICGPAREVQQGKNVADMARDAGVQHLVYGSAGTGQVGSGIPSWETKLQVEAYMRQLGLPVTVLRPMAFMELLTHKKFFPAASTWRLMPAVMGDRRPVGWICVDDLGAVVARVFAEPERYVGQDLSLASDVQSLAQCRVIYRRELGRRPPSMPVPAWLFRRFGFVGEDLTTMWRWLRTATIDLDTGPTRAIYPEARTVRAWLRGQRTA